METQPELREKRSGEKDRMDRNTKKAKGGDQAFSNKSSMLVYCGDIEGEPHGGAEANSVKTYKQSILGVVEKDKDASVSIDSDINEEALKGMEKEVEEVGWKGEGRSIDEKLYGRYECPKIILFEKEEACTCRPWKQGVIMKLLGRKIGFKALENIVDVGNKFVLVAFSCKED